jgi:hypothetical protein
VPRLVEPFLLPVERVTAALVLGRLLPLIQLALPLVERLPPLVERGAR